MAIGLKLQIGNSITNTTETLVFGQFPVRIGRNPLNDLRLQSGFVSQFHAVLELSGDSLMLRDLGSKNGTTLRSGRAPAHEVVDLTSCDGEFSISALSFKAVVEDIGDAVPAQIPQRGLLLGGLGAKGVALQETILCSSKDVAQALSTAAYPLATKAVEGASALRSKIDAFRTSRATINSVLQTIAVEVASVPEEQRESLLAWSRENFPGISEEPEFKRLVEHHCANVDTKDAESQVRRLEYVALQAVRELSSLYDPRGAPLGAELEVVQFLTRVRDTLDVFFKTFIPLRDGHRQFKSEMDIPSATSSRAGLAERAAASVGTAKTPLALAGLLLGSSDGQPAACKAVEGTFADLMIHQLALLSGVMRGVHSLMQELAPGTIEADLEVRHRKSMTGFMLGPYRFRELWRVFVSRHADLTESEKQLYSHVFGQDFVHAYAQLSEGSPAQTGSPRSRPGTS